MAMAGPADFDHVARAYIATHPSRHPSVRWYGRDMADFLATTEPYNRTPAAAEMARFEWASGEAFDSPDVTPITADALMALPQEAWETLSFTTLPSLRRLILAFEAPQAWQRREEVEPGDLPVERAPEPLTWAIWPCVTTYRISEAAELLGVSDDTVRRWVDAGSLAVSDDDAGRSVIDGADLAALAVERARTPEDAAAGTQLGAEPASRVWSPGSSRTPSWHRSTCRPVRSGWSR